MVNEYLAPSEVIDGIYPLGALMRRSVGSVIYETKFGDGEGAVPAVIRIREVEWAEAENLNQRLRNVGQLQHPNLLKIYAAGSSLLNGVPVFYVVMERADESLEAVLAERALTSSETREMLVPALEALDYLHKNGYTHTSLKPSNVLAVNDRLKLSTDSVIPLTDAGAAAAETAEDMRALGVLIVQALTQKIPNSDEPWESLDFEAIPQPLADIVRHCLDPDCAGRWTVEQVKVRLNAPAVLVEKLGPRPGVPKWIYAGLAALILTVILLSVLRNNHSVTVAPAAVVGPRESAAVSLPLVRPAPPVEAPQAPQAASPQPGDRKASGWAVIVGAYRSRELAEKRMREMTKRWPNFEIGVLESQGEKAPYLLVLGRNLSEDQAQALRKRALKSRLPAGAYIKRVM